MSPLEYVIEKAIEANPSIKDLVFGCQVQYNKDFPQIIVTPETKYNRIISVYTKNNEICPIEDISEFEIIGREVRLADVLYVFDKEAETQGYDTREELISVLDSWNLLKDDIRLQSPETQLFIARLLGYKE